MIKRLLAFTLFSTVLSAPTIAQEQNSEELAERKEAFIQTTASNFDLDAAVLREVLSSATLNQDVLDAIQKPWEARPWHEYYPIFLTQRRIERGVEFWRTHSDTLERAEKEFGVPAHIIVAIIGVETFYGEYMGNYPVLDALYTLGFYYPPRAAFFRSELGEFMRLTDREGLDLAALKGSYAGAMGFGQFISSSYHHYAVDFDGDGVRDLFNNPVDAIGSVANYFARHNWKRGEAVAVPAWPNRVAELSQLTSGPGQRLTHTVDGLHDAGVDFVTQQPGDSAARLFEFEEQSGHSYWVGLPNFYAITRYNHSPLYAMAVYLLSEEIRHAHAK